MANPMLQHYVKLTEFLGQALGPDYEVALYDLTEDTRPIIAITNSHVSGRGVGMPLTDTILQTLLQKDFNTWDYHLHSRTVSPDGKTLYCSTLLLRQDSQPIGMLCINFDDSRYQSLVQDILHLCHPGQYTKTMPDHETASMEGRMKNSITSVAQDAIVRELEQLGINADRLTAEERVKMIAVLEARGIFLLKGAIKDVAEAMHCSQASVYRYLSQVRNEGFPPAPPKKKKI